MNFIFWIGCLLFGHDWRFTCTDYPSGETYELCSLCHAKRKRTNNAPGVRCEDCFEAAMEPHQKYPCEGNTEEEETLVEKFRSTPEGEGRFQQAAADELQEAWRDLSIAQAEIERLTRERDELKNDLKLEQGISKQATEASSKFWEMRGDQGSGNVFEWAIAELAKLRTLDEACRKMKQQPTWDLMHDSWLFDVMPALSALDAK